MEANSKKELWDVAKCWECGRYFTHTPEGPENHRYIAKPTDGVAMSEGSCPECGDRLHRELQEEIYSAGGLHGGRFTPEQRARQLRAITKGFQHGKASWSQGVDMTGMPTLEGVVDLIEENFPVIMSRAQRHRNKREEVAYEKEQQTR